MRKYAKLRLLSVPLSSAAVAAQEPNPNWKKEPDQEPPEQAKQEAQKPDTKASAGDLTKAVQNHAIGLLACKRQRSGLRQRQTTG